MGHSSLTYQERFEQYLQESQTHLLRIDEAFAMLTKRHHFLLDATSFAEFLHNPIDMAFADQIIYRFSKVQDTMGAKLFKAFLLYQGENVDHPFRDILNSLEQQGILDVEEWFALREIRNEIAHNYDNNTETACHILNSIYQQRDSVRRMLETFSQYVGA